MKLSTRLAISLFLLVSVDADLGGGGGDSNNGNGNGNGNSNGSGSGSGSGKGKRSSKSSKSSKGKMSSKSSKSKSSKSRRTRALLTTNSVSLKQDDPYYQEIISRCGEYEYDASLYVDTHVFGVASPKEIAIAAGCPFIATHAALSQEPKTGSVVAKEILVWDSREKAKRFKDEGFYPVGTLIFSDIARAIDNAEPTRSNIPLFDVWHNNCADYIVNLGSELGLEADDKVTSFVVRRLMENYGKEWLDNVRYNMNFFSVFGGRRLGEENIADEDVIELLVETRTSGLN